MACQGTVCPFCHPHDYVKLSDPEPAEEPAELVLRQPAELGALIRLYHAVVALALCALGVKGVLFVVYPAGQEPQPTWMTFDDPNLGNWLAEGLLGLLAVRGAMCCNMSFRPAQEERLGAG
jgi:hypothetical protein